MKEYFKVNSKQYAADKCFDIVRPASLNFPKNNAVMFIERQYLDSADAFLKCSDCLIFWPNAYQVPEAIRQRHAVILCEEPRKGFCSFFKENNIVSYPQKEEYNTVEGAIICKTAKIGANCTILPGAYIGGEVIIGNNCYIGAGVRLVGEVHIGDNVVIRENSVIGADGLSTDRDDEGKALTMPQFGGVIIESDVQVGALTVIARGAIDHTVIKRGVKIDNSTFISHNAVVGEDSFIVGETIMFGSSSLGKRAYVSGNSTIRNGVHIGDKAFVGMGSVVTESIENNRTVKGNPAR